jgi:peptide methionine sulfoxide reductase MsrA
MEKNLETATLAAGCFWCVEAVFDDLKGVVDVVSVIRADTRKPVLEKLREDVE